MPSSAVAWLLSIPCATSYKDLSPARQGPVCLVGATHLILGLGDVVPADLDPRLEEGLCEVVDVDPEQMRHLELKRERMQWNGFAFESFSFAVMLEDLNSYFE